MSDKKTLLELTEAYVVNFFKKNIKQEYYYHSIKHTKGVVKSVQEISATYDLPKMEREALEIAAWFHDSGYSEGAKNHELRGAGFARAFLEKQQFPPERTKLVASLILVTNREEKPTTLLEKIMKDADLCHVGKKESPVVADLLRTEWEITEKRLYSDKEWLEINLDFFQQHQFYTPVAKGMYQQRKWKNMARIHETLSEMEERDHFDEAQPKRPTRGIETMFRVTLRNHINLSQIADNKANIMLSINAILISLILSVLLPQFAAQPKLVLPSTVLLAVCLISVVYATLSTRPKVTEGTFTEKDFLDKKVNLLFFGNFYKMPQDKFQWGMNKMMEDEDLLYNAMTTDLYFLGLVLAKKYAYLRICYNFFMYGLLISAAAFMLTYFFM